MQKVSSTDILYSAFLKVKRAEHHIDNFCRLERQYINARRRASRRVAGKDQIFGGHLSTDAPIIIGDVIHNLRTSLDHAFYALVLSNGQEPDHNTQFPFNREKDKLLEKISKMKTRPNDDVLQYIVDKLKPYESGGDLYGVHKLDIADKHKFLIETNAVMAIEELTTVSLDGGYIGPSISGINIVLPSGSKGAAVRVDRNLKAQIKGDPNNIYDIRFGFDQPFANENVLSKMKYLSHLTLKALEGLRALA